MKDIHPDKYRSHRSQCPFSDECVSLLDMLDGPSGLLPADSSDDEDEAELQQKVVRLRAHVQSCPICQEAVTQARRQRERLRGAIRLVMNEAETAVPSTTSSILLALRREQQGPGALSTITPVSLSASRTAMATPVSGPGISELNSGRTQEQTITDTPAAETNYILKASSRRSRGRARHAWYYAPFLAAAAVLIVLAMNLFRFAPHLASMNAPAASRSVASQSVSSGKANQTQHTSAPPTVSQGDDGDHTVATTPDWSSVLMVRGIASSQSQLIENYNPTTKKTGELRLLPKGASVDGISHQGNNLIYHVYDASNNVTSYFLLDSLKIVLSGKGTNAVWSTDDSYIYIVNQDGVVWQINVQPYTDTTSVKRLMSLSTSVDRLMMVHDQFLYFNSGGRYYRVDITGNDVQVQQLANGAVPGRFWLDPYSDMFYYYRSSGTSENDDLYAASLDAPAQGFLVGTSLTLIGYGDSNTLIGLRYDQNSQRFELVDIDKTSWSSQLLSDTIAPGAQSFCQSAQAKVGAICDESVALSPLPENQGVLFGARYAGGDYRVQFMSFQDDAVHDLFTADGESVQFIGWDKLAA